MSRGAFGRVTQRMRQAQKNLGERVGRRSLYEPESYIAGHMVKNHMTVINRWSAAYLGCIQRYTIVYIF